MAPNSSPVVAGVDAVQASQYNDLRDDILHISTGHDHGGTGERGVKLSGSVALDSESVTLDEMEHITRKILVPWVGVTRAINWDDRGKHVGGWNDVQGAEFLNLYGNCHAYTGWMVPPDFVSNLTAQVIFHQSSMFNKAYRIQFTLGYGHLGSNSSEYTSDTGQITWIDEGADQGDLMEGPSLNLASAEAEHIVRFKLSRFPDHPEDEETFRVQSHGVVISYTAAG